MAWYKTQREPIEDSLEKLFAKHILKGGKREMETKSRFEVMSELEEKKHELMNDLSGMDLSEAQFNNKIEKLQEELKEFQATKDLRVQGLKEQIESIDNSLKRFNSQKK